MKKIAIIGSSGMLGQPVTQAFVQSGFEVTVLARDPEKIKKLFGPGVNIVQGDVKNTTDLGVLLAQQHALYLNLSVTQTSSEKDFQPERDGLKNILSVAQTSGIQHIGYLSSLVHLYQGQNGFNWWAFDIKQKAVQAIRSGGLNYSIFYPSTFMESFDKGGYRLGNTINLAGKSKYPMHFIAGSDYAQCVVKAFEHQHQNNEYVIQGPEAYIADDAAKIFVEHYTKTKMKVRKAPFAALKVFGALNRKMNYGRHIVEALNNYPEKFEAQKTWEELGKPSTTLAEYARRG